MAVSRYYSSVARRTTLTADVNASATSLSIAAATGFPSLYPYTLILDQDTVNEEIVTVTNRSSTTLTVVRGADGTSGTAHTAGASVEHGVSARDFTESRQHEDNTENVHGTGAGSAVVGTTTAQTLTNKTLTSPTINSGTINNATVVNPTFTGDIKAPAAFGIEFEGTTDDAFETRLIAAGPTADRVVSLPDATATLVGRDTTDTLTNKTVSAGTLSGTTTNTGTISGGTVSGATITSGTLSNALNANSQKITGLATPTDTGDAATKGYVDTTTVASAGDTMTGALAMGSNKITGLGTPTLTGDAATKGYVDTSVAAIVDAAPGTLDTLNELAAALGDDPNFATTVTNSIATKVAKAGDTMTGNLAMSGGAKVTGLPTPSASGDAAPKSYTDTKLALTGGTVTGDITMSSGAKVTGLPSPTASSDATSKDYIDTLYGTTAAASVSASAAAASAGAASGSATAASGSASSASSSASAASVSASAALASQNAAAASFDSFDDRYLGAKSTDPTLDNDGNALITGALYFNSVSGAMKVYSGAAWDFVAPDTSSFISKAIADAKGDLIAGTANDTIARIGVGANDTVLIADSAESTGLKWASVPQSSVSNLTTDLAAKAPLASPTFTGTPTLPTGTIGTTQSVGNDTTAIATTAFVNAEIANDAVSKAIVDAKGDLIVATAADTVARLGVGSNGQALVADSTAATGVKWASPSGGVTATDTITAAGVNALRINTGADNTAFGRITLYSNTSGPDNSAFGDSALYANTTGNSNTAAGKSASQNNTTGMNNTAVGRNSLAVNTTGDNNTALGSGALDANTSASDNTAVGRNALGASITGVGNTAVGSSALSVNTAWYNVAVGYDAISANTTGQENIAIGVSAGYTNTTGSNNTFIGKGAIGASATTSNAITLGNASIATLRCQVTSITALSDARDKTNVKPIPAGLDFINRLKPVEFDWNTRDGAKVDVPDMGFIAQDLLAVQEETGIDIPNLVYKENPEKLEAAYGTLIPVLVQAIKELSEEVRQLKEKCNE